ncbi:MAG TPA: hypothetical protein VN442_18800 [Bryobacteraceae bacterium]|nr:hypothetical protein [Bryobacteraceae bacterium]
MKNQKTCAKCKEEVLDEGLCKRHFHELVTHEPGEVIDERRICRNCKKPYDTDLDKWAMCWPRLIAWQGPRLSARFGRTTEAPR